MSKEKLDNLIEIERDVLRYARLRDTSQGTVRSAYNARLHGLWLSQSKLGEGLTDVELECAYAEARQ